MILTKLYRLQKKKGAVLFVVIAMMTLLVIMATTAYMTARSSYKTVINNYDFSQLYLSAVSVSDMMVGAVTNDTVDKGTGAKNNFDELREAIIDTSFSIGAKITAKSNNITDDMDSAEKILAGTANNPVESGVLDAVEVVITHESQTTKDKITGDPDDKGIKYDYYLFTTTAYYRSNTVSIQDRVAREWGEPEDGTLFDTFFTATGKTLEGDNLSRCAVIATFDISDDAFFENEYTVFTDDGSNNTFKGGITSAGNVWLDQFTCDIPDATGSVPPEDKWDEESSSKVKGTRNDWFIGGSLIFGGNAQTWDIGNNNLYVKGDLILTKNMNTFKAKNIYVTGNLIDLSGSASSSIDANIYVNGTFLTDLDTTKGTDQAKQIKQNALNTISMTNGVYKSTMLERGSTVGDLNGSSAVGGDTSGFNLKAGNKLYINNVTNSNLNTALQSRLEGSWDASGVHAPVEFKVVESGGYETYVNYNKNVSEATENETQRNSYYSYSASDLTMANSITIDFSTTYADPDGNTVSYDFFLNGVTDDPLAPKATVTVNNAGKTTINLPYVENGYVLDLKFDGSIDSYHKVVEYNIDSGSTNESMLPIVLKANYNDGSGYTSDSRGKNAFNWNVSGWGGGLAEATQNNRAFVKVTGQGDVFFEMGNYAPGGEYSKFTVGSGLCTTTYVASQHAVVGTANQVAAIMTDGNTTQIEAPTDYDNLFETDPYDTSKKLSDTLPGYDNQIMLISNKNGGVSINTSQMRSAFCGYFYAPFSTYDSYCGSESTPVCGGIIVSDYVLHQSHFVYAEPDPQLIENLGKALPTKDNLSDEDKNIWHTNDASIGAGSNFLG